MGSTTSPPTPARPRSSARRTSRSRTTSATCSRRSIVPSSGSTTAPTASANLRQAHREGAGEGACRTSTSASRTPRRSRGGRAPVDAPRRRRRRHFLGHRGHRPGPRPCDQALGGAGRCPTVLARCSTGRAVAVHDEPRRRVQPRRNGPRCSSRSPRSSCGSRSRDVVPPHERRDAVALGLVLGGAVGNLTDRIVRGPGPVRPGDRLRRPARLAGVQRGGLRDRGRRPPARGSGRAGRGRGLGRLPQPSTMLADRFVGEPGRLDAVVAAAVGASRADVQRAIAAGGVTVDGRRPSAVVRDWSAARRRGSRSPRPGAILRAAPRSRFATGTTRSRSWSSPPGVLTHPTERAS